MLSSMEQIISSTFGQLTDHLWQAGAISALVIFFTLIQLWRREVSKL